jgi:hypothetical protein
VLDVRHHLNRRVDANGMLHVVVMYSGAGVCMYFWCRGLSFHWTLLLVEREREGKRGAAWPCTHAHTVLAARRRVQHHHVIWMDF